MTYAEHVKMLVNEVIANLPEEQLMSEDYALPKMKVKKMIRAVQELRMLNQFAHSLMVNAMVEDGWEQWLKVSDECAFEEALKGYA